MDNQHNYSLPTQKWPGNVVKVEIRSLFDCVHVSWQPVMYMYICIRIHVHVVLIEILAAKLMACMMCISSPFLTSLPLVWLPIRF